MNKYANGLGPTSWGRWCLLLPFRDRFNKVGIQHDIAYCLGTTEEDKRLADFLFFEGMSEASGKNPIAILFSIIYFTAVHYFGNIFFNYETNKH